MDLTLQLPKPAGVVPVRVTGGAFKSRILRPSGIPARLVAASGFFKLTFDDQVHEMMGGRMTFQSPDFTEAVDRYEIEINGGANEVTVQ